MKILIVDDSQDLAFTLQLMLEAEGFEVMSAKDGREGYLAYLGFQTGPRHYGYRDARRNRP